MTTLFAYDDETGDFLGKVQHEDSERAEENLAYLYKSYYAQKRHDEAQREREESFED